MPGHQDQPCIAVSSLPLAPGVPHTQSERGTSGGGGRQGATRLGCPRFLPSSLRGSAASPLPLFRM